MTPGAPPPPRRVHFFVCTNERPPDSFLPCCHARGGPNLLAAFQAEFARRGWPRGVKVTGATCLTTCQRGCTVVVYPDGIWYGPVDEDDVPELFDAHLNTTGPVTRLLVPQSTPVW